MSIFTININSDNEVVLKKLNQIMATFEDFKVQLDRIVAAQAETRLDIAEATGKIDAANEQIKTLVENAGLDKTVEDEILAQLTIVADESKAIAELIPEPVVEPPVEL